jgi:uncharacterized Zn finger protein
MNIRKRLERAEQLMQQVAEIGCPNCTSEGEVQFTVVRGDTEIEPCQTCGEMPEVVEFNIARTTGADHE